MNQMTNMRYIWSFRDHLSPFYKGFQIRALRAHLVFKSLITFLEIVDAWRLWAHITAQYLSFINQCNWLSLRCRTLMCAYSKPNVAFNVCTLMTKFCIAFVHIPVEWRTLRNHGLPPLMQNLFDLKSAAICEYWAKVKWNSEFMRVSLCGLRRLFRLEVLFMIVH